MKSLLLFTLGLVSSLELYGVKTVKNDIFLDEQFETGYAKMEPRGHMFFWHIPSRNAADKAPLIMWLSGGPGCGSDLAVLGINGPWWVDEETVTLKKNEHSWTNHANMLYVDQPLGSGFSTADLNYKFTATGVSKDLHSFLEKFLELHPDYKNRPFFLAGESYAGKYVPNIGEYIVDHPIEGLDFKGIAVGNGWVNPSSQYPAYAQFGHEEGLIRPNVYPLLKRSFDMCGSSMNSPFWPVTLPVCNMLTMGVLGGRSPYHIDKQCKNPPQCIDAEGETLFLNREDVRATLGVLGHVGRWRACNPAVQLALLGEYAKSSLPAVESVLAAGKLVLFYYGDRDFICNWRGGERWLDTLAEQKVHEKSGNRKKIWHHKKALPSVPFIKWGHAEEGEGSAGTLKKNANFVFARIFNAGHMAPRDKPKVASFMLKAFIDGGLHDLTSDWKVNSFLTDAEKETEITAALKSLVEEENEDNEDQTSIEESKEAYEWQVHTRLYDIQDVALPADEDLIQDEDESDDVEIEETVLMRA